MEGIVISLKPLTHVVESVIHNVYAALLHNKLWAVSCGAISLVWVTEVRTLAVGIT